MDFTLSSQFNHNHIIFNGNMFDLDLLDLFYGFHDLVVDVNDISDPYRVPNGFIFLCGFGFLKSTYLKVAFGRSSLSSFGIESPTHKSGNLIANRSTDVVKRNALSMYRFVNSLVNLTPSLCSLQQTIIILFGLFL